MNVVAGFGGGEEFAIRRANDTSGVARKVASEIGAVRLAQAADMRRGDVVGLPVRAVQLQQLQCRAAGRQHNDKDSEAQQKKCQRVAHSYVDNGVDLHHIGVMRKSTTSWVDRLIPEPNSGCWLFEGRTTSGGYGSITLEGKPHGLHRLMWEHVNGPIPKGMHVLHRCDVRSCGNPDHLFLGTHQDNMRDMQQKRKARGVAMGKDRLSVSVTAPQYRWLTSEAKRLGITIGELIRRIVDAARDSK